MQNYVSKIVNNKFVPIIIFVLLLPIILPFMNLIIEVILNSGRIVGTFIRNFSSQPMCM
jgi:hypothetical protein